MTPIPSEGRPHTHPAFRLTHDAWQRRPVVQLVRPCLIGDVIVPRGFQTDWSSTLPILGVLSRDLAVFGLSARASLRHDYDCWRGVPRAERSETFLRIMLADGVHRWAARLQYLAVRYWPGPERVSQRVRVLEPEEMTGGPH